MGNLDSTGRPGSLDTTHDRWTVSKLQNVEMIDSVDDLPEPSGGVHQLEDNVGYKFNGFIASQSGLQLGNPSPLLGTHGALDGFIRIGGGTALQGSGPVMMRDMYMHAPGGTIFNVDSGDQTTEWLMESVSFSDAAGMGSIASLGTVNNYRVPSFKGVNFEDFDDGITFGGSPDKIFFEGCPFRNVTASGATIVEAGPSLDVDIFKISTDCYIKDVQPDTQVAYADPSATINEYFKYFNVDHDSTVDKTNILSGSIAVEKVGTIVRNAFPIADSGVTSDISLDSPTTVTGSGAGPTEITSGTWTANIDERVSLASPGIVQYNAKYDTDIEIDIRLSVSGANTTFTAWIAHNGSIIDRASAAGDTANTNAPSTVSTETVFQDASSDVPDQFSIFLENTGGTGDLDADSATIKISDL